MKFLLFNIFVIGALIYLFAADRPDYHATADRLFDTVGKVKSGAEITIDKAKSEFETNRSPGLETSEVEDRLDDAWSRFHGEVTGEPADHPTTNGPSDSVP